MPKVAVATLDYEKIEAMLENRFWTWCDLALHSDMSYNMLYKLRHGSRSASFKTIRKIAKALNVEPKEIVLK